MHPWFVRQVELSGCPWVGAIGRAAWYYPEGAACGGASDGAALVDDHGGGARPRYGAGHRLLFALEYPHPLADLFGWPALLQDAGHPIIQAAVFLEAYGLLAVHVYIHSSQ